MREKRLTRLEENALKADEDTRYRVGQKIEARWRRPTSFSKPQVVKTWVRGRIRKQHSDGTYTVEYEDEKVEDSVPEEHIRNIQTDRDEGEEKREADSKRKKVDDWDLLFSWAQDLGIVRDTAKRTLMETRDEEERLKLLLRSKAMERYRDAYNKVDPKGREKVDMGGVLDAFDDLGARASPADVKSWLAKRDEDEKRFVFTFLDFMKCLAAVFAPQRRDAGDSQVDNKREAITLKRARRSEDHEDLRRWAKKLGDNKLKDLEDAFRARAQKIQTPDHPQVGFIVLKVKDLRSTFLALGYDISRTQLDKWMEELDLQPGMISIGILMIFVSYEEILSIVLYRCSLVLT